MTLKRSYIQRIFADPLPLMVEGIYFSGRFGKGEYMEWYDNGQLALHCFFRNGEYHGEYSEWFDDGRLAMRLFYKNGKRIEPK